MRTGQETSRVTATTLTAHHFLHGLPAGQIAKLVPAACLVTVPSGHRLFEDGGSAASFWLIRSGSVALDLHIPGPEWWSSRRWAWVTSWAGPGCCPRTSGPRRHRPAH